MPYQTRLADLKKLPMSNIYGHQMTVVNDLKTDEFRQYWKQLPASKKQAIVVVSEKELNMQIKESVYWFSLRYAMENYAKIFTDSRRIGISRNESGFYLPPEMITEEKMSQMIDFAAMYDRCVMPAFSSRPSQLFNELESDALSLCQKRPEEVGIHYCILRFKMFLYWLLCNHMDEAFQMHKKEEEADREAELLLQEPVNKEKKKTKKKKRAKKAATTPAAAQLQSQSPSQSPSQTSSKEPTKEEKATTSEKDSMKGEEKKEETINETASLPPSEAPPSPSASLQNSLKPESTNTPTSPPSSSSLEAQRICRLLLGDGYEGTANSQKRGRPEVNKPAFISLHQLFLRKDPLEDIIRNSVSKRNSSMSK